MNRIFRHYFKNIFILCIGVRLSAGGHELPEPILQSHNIYTDTIPLKDRPGDFTKNYDKNPFDLEDPNVIEKTIEYDPAAGEYKVTEKIGSDYFRAPTSMSFDEFLKFKQRQQDREYYKNLAGISTTKRNVAGIVDPISKVEIKRNLADRLFGGLGIDIKPQGSIEMDLGMSYNKNYNPFNITSNLNNFSPLFDMRIQMDVVGNIGDKLKLNTNYNTQASFDFENKLKLEYDSEKFSEDDIIKKIEAGNVSLPLRSNLIQGSQNLFGFKTDWQFGHLRLTGVLSQQKSKQENIQTKGGGVVQDFEIRPDQFDENRHFFLSHYNRNTFEGALTNLPEINSQMRIKDIEVWLTEDGQNSQQTDLRDIVALADLGTPGSLPFDFSDPSFLLPGTATPRDLQRGELPVNTANKLLDLILADSSSRELNKIIPTLTSLNLKQGRDFEKVRAKRLSSSEYTYNPELGFISLRVRPRPNQVLAVSYHYTYNGKVVDPRTGAQFKVGEFSSEVRSDSLHYRVLFTKLLKSSTQSTALPSWDLMMKNVYPIGGYNLNNDDFKFDIFHEAQDGKQKRFIPELDGYPLLNLFRLDFLNQANDPQPDGIFDFVPGQTVIPASGSVIFPVLEPFGKSLRTLVHEIIPNDLTLEDSIFTKYNYSALYDTSITLARRDLKSNQFLLKGSFKSGKSNEISLRTGNLDPNAKIIVKAGSLILNEGSDYTVDRSLGKVIILNEGYLQSDVPIDVSFEDNSLFSFQTKTMVGLRAEYSKKKDLYVGATYMHLFERPFTQKVNLGEDPINNKIYGLDFGLTKQAPWLTRTLDKLPLYSTKEPSKWSLQAEGALLDPGHSKAINQKGSDGGVIYIDDFEGAATGIGLFYNVTQWMLASSPSGIDDVAFKPGGISNNLISSSNRSLLNWYRIDDGARQGAQDVSHSYARRIDENEIFPNKYKPTGFTSEITFDMSYYPREKGPYNYDITGGLVDTNGTKFTFGVDQQNKLLQPTTRWAGIMSKLNTNDFETANVEYFDFWMLNPFMSKFDNSNITNSGTMYLQIGNFSEDIFKDGNQQYENGIPTPNLNLPTTNSVFGKISRVPPITNTFDIQNRERQDVGFDGLNSLNKTLTLDESAFFSDYLSKLVLDPTTLNEVQQDPSNDDFLSYRAAVYRNSTVPVLERYKKYNNPEGNAQIELGNQISTAYTGSPDAEDINFDKSLNEVETFYSYKIPIAKNASGDQIDFDFMDVNNFITDTIHVVRGNLPEEIWYRYRIPINKYNQKVGEINDFRSIQSMRILYTEFDESVTFRFINFQLGRNLWRRYELAGCKNDVGAAEPFILDKVDVEENSEKTPFKYVLPKGIERERFFSTQYADLKQNETSLLLRQNNFDIGCDQSIYKLLDLDFRRYKRLKMFVHAESPDDIQKGQTCVYLKLGKDFTNNYYEYEIPLRMSPRVPEAFANSDSIWLAENEFDFPLQLLIDAKNKRNEMNIDPSVDFEMVDPEKPANKVRIKGNPTLGLVRGGLIGIRNKDAKGYPELEVWVNELRLTGIDEKGGFAAIARAEVQLADLGTLSMAANYSTTGWGGIDQKLDQRALDEIVQYDATSNIELGKFLPKKTGIRIPFSAQYSTNHRTPEFDPNDTDVKLSDKLDSAPSKSARDSIRDRAIDQTQIKSFAFNNVRKDKVGSRKTRPWSIENFGVSYSQSITDKKNPIVAIDRAKAQTGGLDYNYSVTTKYIEPFKKVVKNKNLKIISDLNFNLLPNAFSVRNSLDRKYSKRTYRFADPKYSTWEDAKFGWLRDYSLTWDLTRNLKLNFSAQNEAAVDEITYNPLKRSYINPITGLAVAEDERKPFVVDNLKNFGRTKDYKHNITASYTIPTRLIPFLDWVSSRIQYTANYNWSAGSLKTIDTLGSVVSNGHNLSLSGELNLVTLYNKVPYLRKVNGDFKNSNRIRPSAKKPGLNEDTEKPQSKKKKPETSKDPDVGFFGKVFVRPLMSLRRIQLNYSQNESTVVPGFLEKTELLGLNKKFSAPGWDFIAGVQPDFGKNGWLDKAAAKGWISSNLFFSKEMTQRKTNNFGAKIKIEPFKDFNIDLNIDRNFTRDHSESFKFDSVFDVQNQVFTDPAFQHFTPYENGQFSISFISLQTLFKNDIDKLFTDFSDRRTRISKRVGETYNIPTPSPTNPIYTDGFLGDHQDVVIPAFISAYTNTSTDKVKLDPFKTIPLPNWQINYSGLSKIGIFKEIFQDFSIRHGYKNTLTMNSYKTNLDYKENSNSIPIARKGNVNTASYYAKFEIPDVVVSESFSPLIGVNIKTKNGIELGVTLDKSRNLNFKNGVDGHLMESKATNYTIKAGYTIKNLYLSFIPGMEKVKKPLRKKKGAADPKATANKPKGNDLQISFDFGIRDDISKIHELDKNINAQTTSGSKQITLSPSAQYSINKNLNLRLFMDYRKSIPYVQNSYKDVHMNAGLTVQFLLN